MARRSFPVGGFGSPADPVVGSAAAVGTSRDCP